MTSDRILQKMAFSLILALSLGLGVNAQENRSQEATSSEPRHKFNRLKVTGSGTLNHNVPVSFIEMKDGKAIFSVSGELFTVSPFPMDGSFFRERSLRCNYVSCYTEEGSVDSLFFFENGKTLMEVIGNAFAGNIGIGKFKISKGVVTDRPWGGGQYRHAGALISGPAGYRREVGIGETVELSAEDGTWFFLLVDGRVNIPDDGSGTSPKTRFPFVAEAFKETFRTDYIIYRK